MLERNRDCERLKALRATARGRRVTGTVRADSIADWLPTFSDSLPVRVEIDAARYVILPNDPAPRDAG